MLRTKVRFQHVSIVEKETINKPTVINAKPEYSDLPTWKVSKLQSRKASESNKESKPNENEACNSGN